MKIKAEWQQKNPIHGHIKTRQVLDLFKDTEHFYKIPLYVIVS